MKRSKIFLAATTALLAVIGVVCAKAHKAFSPITYYSSAHQCLFLVSGVATTRGPGIAVGNTGFLCTNKSVYLSVE